VEAVCDRVAILRRGELVQLQPMNELREGRTVQARLIGPAPLTDPEGKQLSPENIANGQLNLTFRGPLPKLLDWLAHQPVVDLKIEPQGLGPIYRRVHGTES
jgi:ABC-2 type transport system ATP-binding protein